jgi:aldose 1-epimerase
MTALLTLETDDAIVEVVPDLGGSIAAFDVKAGGDRLPVFRRWARDSENPRSLSSSPLLPWFNRISGGGFTFAGEFHPIAPNDPLDAFPLHGDGWTSPWDVIEQGPTSLSLRLRSRAIPPFDYEATQRLTLTGATLRMDLAIRHLGPKPLPYGLGQHPWFPRTRGVTLYAPATGAWLEQPPDFAPKTEPAPIPEDWDFSTPRKLPESFFDNGFAGWNGKARIVRPENGLAVDIEADPGSRYYHVYSPGAHSPIFCFEPVTHPNNALGKPGTPEENGLRVLAPGEETSLRATFAARRI